MDNGISRRISAGGRGQGGREGREAGDQCSGSEMHVVGKGEKNKMSWSECVRVSNEGNERSALRDSKKRTTGGAKEWTSRERRLRSG